MSTTQMPERTMGLPELALYSQETLDRLSAGYSTMLKGWMDLAQRQVEMSREMAEAGMEDFALIARAGTPEALVRAELEVIQRSSERTLKLAQNFAERMTRMWTEAGAFACNADGAASGGKVRESMATH